MTAESPEPERTLESYYGRNPELLSPEFIEEKLNYRLVVTFPNFLTNKAGLIEYHEELERLGTQCGWDNVFGSMFYWEDRLQLGIFIDQSYTSPQQD